MLREHGARRSEPRARPFDLQTFSAPLSGLPLEKMLFVQNTRKQKKITRTWRFARRNDQSGA
jgi:hypothetical protein